MIALVIFVGISIFGAFLLLQVIGPLFLGKKTFSWWRDKSRLDNAKHQFRVAQADALAEDAEDVLHEFLDDRIDEINKR